ncbi:phage baseplate protein [Beduinella massiliensis]|uniref:phage baseplate protein n=1 Tax=Beduinella massiliensis TaxID=1852363 RepID=UPI000C84CA5D
MNGQITGGVRAIIDRVYPIGIILDFAVESDPNTSIGCGTVWQRIADGRALIASDAAHPVGWTGGEAAHTLINPELPSHYHDIAMAEAGGSPYWGPISITQLSGSKWSTTKNTGGGEPHNNMQPSLAVCRWVRTA